MPSEYHQIPNYTMKCRLYPNKSQAKAIDEAIYAVQCYHNCVMWDIFHNHVSTVEKPYSPKAGKVTAVENDDIPIKPGAPVHFIDKSLRTVFSAAYKKNLIEEHPVIEKAPAGAITTNNGLKGDMIRSLRLTKTDGIPANSNPVEFRKPVFYSAAHPRRSYTYQETFGKLTASDNPRVLFIHLAKIGKVKLRGWNQNIRFDKDGTLDFANWFRQDSIQKAYVTVTISRDKCNDYWICFKLSGVYKQIAAPLEPPIGIDAGISDIAITSAGKKYPNRKFKKAAAKRHRALNRRLSRRQGWSNINFREAHKTQPTLSVSKRYMETRLSLAKLDRTTARKREYCNHCVSYELIRDHPFIGVESLNVKGMFQNRHLANALSDAGIYQLLLMLQYKSSWYGRTVQPIDQWTPSSKRCSSCKEYIYQNLTLNVREWTCPVCGTWHDRDINAAKNILDYALTRSRQASA